MSEVKKHYTVEEAQKIVRAKLTQLKAPEEAIVEWEQHIATNLELGHCDIIAASLESGESEFERKATGEITLVLEHGLR